MPRERLDQIVKIASVRVADPDRTDAVIYNVMLDDELVERWRIPLFDLENNIVSLQMDLSEVEGYPAGTFPKGYRVIVGQEKDDPDAAHYTIEEFIAFADAFDLVPDVRDGNAVFAPVPEGQGLSGFNRQTVVTARCRLDRPLENPGRGLRYVTAWIGATGGYSGTLFEENVREVWARQRGLRAVPAVGALSAPQVSEVEYRGEWVVQDVDVKVGDVLLVPDEAEEKRYIVQEVEREDMRSTQTTVTATLDELAA